MCRLEIIKRTTNGLLLFCPNANMFQLLFNNVLLNLTDFELKTFTRYIDKVDEEYWEKEYENSIYDKKIPIPTSQKNLMIMLDISEIKELRILMGLKKKQSFLTLSEIDYKLILN
ncbi:MULTISPECIES: DUF6686 family protein [Flavobacterium]|uniref:DUF6686 family protein n=1 Tax=Flavobacterium jumunjinense TaxID=998845 RepID=A0ABV5GR30_9FLAO|nr:MULTISPECIES: DUF6686 family protein [Flavobacterium]